MNKLYTEAQLKACENAFFWAGFGVGGLVMFLILAGVGIYFDL